MKVVSTSRNNRIKMKYNKLHTRTGNKSRLVSEFGGQSHEVN